MHRFIGNVGNDEEPAVNFLRQRKIIDKKILTFTSEEEIEKIQMVDLDYVKEWLVKT